MQLQALNWLNIAQMNLLWKRQITVAVVVDYYYYYYYYYNESTT